jgi:hypothetical protein
VRLLLGFERCLVAVATDLEFIDTEDNNQLDCAAPLISQPGLSKSEVERLMRPNPLPFAAEPNAAADIAVGLSDPSITLIENGPALGVLLAEGCHEDSYSGRLFLERVTWARGDESVRALRNFANVCLYSAEPGVWVAEDVTTGRLFPRPSRLPYHVLFLTAADYRDLRGRGTGSDAGAILAYARNRFASVPGFHMQHERLVSPDGYATAEIMPAGKYVLEPESI